MSVGLRAQVNLLKGESHTGIKNACRDLAVESREDEGDNCCCINLMAFNLPNLALQLVICVST